MNKSKAIDLNVIIRLTINNIKLIIIFTLIGLISAFFFSKYFIKPLYTSDASLYVNNPKQGVSSNTLTINDINLSQRLVDTYIVIIKNDEIVNNIIKRLYAEFTNEELVAFLGAREVNGTVKISNSSIINKLNLQGINETEVLKLTVTTYDANFSAKLCTIIVEEAPNVLQRIVKAGSVEVIGFPKVNSSPVSPNIPKNCAAGALIGAIIAYAIIIARFLFDNTIKGADDIKQHFEIVVLGEIPYIEINTKVANKYGK